MWDSYDIEALPEYGLVVKMQQYDKKNDWEINTLGFLNFKKCFVSFDGAIQITALPPRIESREPTMEMIKNTNILYVEDRSSGVCLYDLHDNGSQLNGSPYDEYNLSIYLYEGHKISFAKGNDESYYFIDLSVPSATVLKNVKRIASTYSDGMLAVQNEDKKWGYVNGSGEFAYDFLFDDAPPFEDGTAQVVYNYQKKTIDKAGNIT